MQNTDGECMAPEFRAWLLTPPGTTIARGSAAGGGLRRLRALLSVDWEGSAGGDWRCGLVAGRAAVCELSSCSAWGRRPNLALADTIRRVGALMGIYRQPDDLTSGRDRYQARSRAFVLVQVSRSVFSRVQAPWMSGVHARCGLADTSGLSLAEITCAAVKRKRERRAAKELCA